MSMLQRVGLLCLLFLIPCAVLIGLLAREKNIAIDFAKDELSGMRYFDAAIPFRAAMAGLGGDIKSALDNLRSVQEKENGTLDSAKNFKALEAALSAGGGDKLLDPYRVLVAQVGDSSKLILDPDLD